MEFLKTKRPHGVLNKKFEHFAKRHSYFFPSGNCYLQVIYMFIFRNLSENAKIYQKYCQMFLCGLGTVDQRKKPEYKNLMQQSL